MEYPKHVVKIGERDENVVKAVKRALNKALALNEGDDLYLDPDNPRFGPKMKKIVKLFQLRNVDADGTPLKQDGEIGSLTWAALFGSDALPVAAAPDDAFVSRVLEIAAHEAAKQVREDPRNSNRGPEVNAYLASTGTPPGHAWCCAFVYWCFDKAASETGRANPMVKTAGCLDHWNKARKKGVRVIPKQEAVADPGLVRPGMVFIADHGGGAGHTGLVEQVTGGLITTIEGNTDASKTREGGGVYRLRRKITDINKGFIQYASA